MTLRFEVLDPPLAGKVFEFPDAVEIVEIGRDPAFCQIVFPADMTKIGRRHVGIRRSLGRFELDTHPSNPVLIDGREPFDDEPLSFEHELRLGVDGPRIRFTASNASALPATEIATPQDSASQKAFRQRRGLLAVAAASAAIVVLVAAVGGWSWWTDAARRTQIAALTADLGTVQDGGTLSPDMLRTVARSTYLILTADTSGREAPVGTSWVYADGQLATNAHVAESFDELQPGQRLIARSTVPPYATAEIVAVHPHPDYAAFTKAWTRATPMRIGPSGDTENVQAPGAGYDVALLDVAPGSRLEASLPLATETELDGLGAGDAVAFAGFPMEMMAGGGVNPKEPVAQIQTGNVTAVSDYFLLPAVGREHFLIQHSLPLTGGASGSPMVNRKGEVVGVISGMNIISADSNRAPNAATVNFAQKADLLKEILAVPSPEDQERRKSAWDIGFRTFDDPVEAIPAGLVASWGQRYASLGKPVLVDDRTGQLDVDEDHSITILDGLLTEPGRYLCIAVSPDRIDLDMAIVRGDDVLEYDRGDDWYPALEFEVERGAEGPSVVVLGPRTGKDAPAPEFRLRIWKLPAAGSPKPGAGATATL